MGAWRIVYWTLVSCGVALSAAASKLYDVTTIYRFDTSEQLLQDTLTRNDLEASVEIHARTNALGMLVSTDENEITEVDVDTPNWHSVDDSNSWRQENWVYSDKSFVETAEFRYVVDWEDDDSVDHTMLSDWSYIKESEDESFVFVPLSEHGTFVLSLHGDSKYYVQVSPEQGWFCESTRVHVNYPRLSGLPGMSPHESCNVVYNFKVPVGNAWSPGFSLMFSLKLSNNVFIFKMFYKSTWHTLLESRVQENYYYYNFRDRVVYQYMYRVGTHSMQGKFFLIRRELDGKPYLRLQAQEGRLVSPVFAPSLNKICVAVKTTITPASHATLQLFAQSPTSGDKFKLGTVDSLQMLEPNILGMSTNRFYVDIPEEFQKTSLQIVIYANRSNDEHVFVHRISGCNVFGDEDLFILQTRKLSNETTPTGFFVADDIPVIAIPDCKSSAQCRETSDDTEMASSRTAASSHVNKDVSKKCLHGGSFDVDSNSCVCPVGFTGDLCEQGCGANRFGQDCGGLCSGSLAGCKYMLLCAPRSSCECAPGLQGELCQSECNVGRYGTGCKQQCGSCKHSTCNPYTGLCHRGCTPNFYPPFCQTPYTHLVVAPVVEKRYFTALTVAFKSESIAVAGEGDPRFYQLQYRVAGTNEWLEQEPQLIRKIDEEILQVASDGTRRYVCNITNLLVGTLYHVRVVLIHSDGESYQADDLKYGQGKTLCTVPHNVDYGLQVSRVEENGFRVDWKYEQEDENWCPVSHFEVHLKEGSRWLVHHSSDYRQMSLEFTDKQPGTTFHVKVRAVTTGGLSQFSPPLAVRTRLFSPESVRNLHVVSAGSTEIVLEWDAPWLSDGNMTYDVHYECVQMLACLEVECGSLSAGRVPITSATSAVLTNLRPHSQYLVSVAATLSLTGPPTTLLATTNYSEVTVAPGADPLEAVTNLGNTSFTLHWSRPDKCTGLNGYLQAYHLQLLLNTSDNQPLLEERRTRSTAATFTNLSPHTVYKVRVYLVTSAGWNHLYFLETCVTTRATVPGPVKQLVVYKRGRKEVGVRWSMPDHLYGELESFTVSSKRVYRGEEQVKSAVVLPHTCPAWPHLYCFTVADLRPDTRYAITVKARNCEVPEDGEPSTVMVITREGGAPGAPVKLGLASRTDTSLAVSWEPPLMLNGLLRSFVVNLEQVDAHNASSCCQYYPLKEIPVREEQQSYTAQFSGLQPASKYTVSVSGKTVALGPSISVSVATRPEVVFLPEAPQLATTQVDNGSATVTLQPSAGYGDLLRAYLLVVIPLDEDSSVPDTQVKNAELAEQLMAAINSTFYVAAEILPDDLGAGRQVVIGSGTYLQHGAVCSYVDPALAPGQYSVGLAAVLEYCGAYALGYAGSSNFTVV